jgi:uncharacterized linocin/CFP29 family protein
MDLLMREDAPLSGEDWATLDHVVVETARRYLQGRRIVPLFGPLGAGLPVIPANKLSGFEPGGMITADACDLLELKQASQDFRLTYRELETAQRLGIPIDMAAPAAAAYHLAMKEDRRVFQGCAEHGVSGLLSTAGSQALKAGSWAKAGGIFADIVKALGALSAAGFPGPYAVGLSPTVYAQAFRPMGPGEQIEMTLIQDIAKAGVVQTPALGDKQLVVLEAGSLNMDLVVGGDMQTAYLGPQGMDHEFRIFESFALRVKRPGSIAVVTSGTG